MSMPLMRVAGDEVGRGAVQVRGADGVVRGTERDQNTVVGVGEGPGAREVGADPVADRQVAGRQGVIELKAPATDCRRPGCR